MPRHSDQVSERQAFSFLSLEEMREDYDDLYDRFMAGEWYLWRIMQKMLEESRWRTDGMPAVQEARPRELCPDGASG